MAGLQEYLGTSNCCPGLYFGYPHTCGFMGDPKRECTCTSLQIQRYRSKISGPLMDRIDLHMEVPPVNDIKFSHVAEAIQYRTFDRRMFR